jgi:hypothetical protein
MNMSPKITDLLVIAGFTATHARTVFPEDTSDDDIIKYASDNDLVIVTYDGRMRKVHQAAYEEYGTNVIFITHGVGDKPLVWQIDWYNTIWPKCYRKIELLPPWKQVRMAADGSIHVYV